jgi:hypothetical protein
MDGLFFLPPPVLTEAIPARSPEHNLNANYFPLQEKPPHLACRIGRCVTSKPVYRFSPAGAYGAMEALPGSNNNC